MKKKKVMEQEKVLKKQMAWRSRLYGMETKVSCDDRETVERGWKDTQMSMLLSDI